MIAAALRLITKKLSASAYGAAMSTFVTTPRPKLSTSHISAPEHRQKFVKERNQSWRGSISLYNSYNGRPTTQTVSVAESNGKVSTTTTIGGKLLP